MKAKQAGSENTADDEKVILRTQRSAILKILYQKSPEALRDININDFDLNFTERMDEAQEVDEEVTPLCYCAHLGLKEIIKVLLTNRQVDVDLETPSNRQTPLMVACASGNYEIARLLLLHQAEPNKPNSLGYVPLATTIFRLVENAHNFESRTVGLKTCELLVRFGANPNWIIDKVKGYSLLHYFCAMKLKSNPQQREVHLDVIEFLLQHGANPAQLSLNDLTPFDLAHSNPNASDILPFFEKT